MDKPVKIDKLVKNIKDSSVYEKIIFDNDVDKEFILKALEIVKLFIIKKKRILVGGMAIDYALRKKKKTLYDENTLPDYDFFSPDFHKDAYDIANELYSAGLKRVQVINAYHASTMRVRTEFQVVADCTYVPDNIYKGLPTVSYKNFNIIHPHYQMLNQHLSLSQPFSGAPYETINRWKKDIKRFNILDKEYPVINKYDESEMNISDYMDFSIKISEIKDLCLNGFAAVLYWYEIAKKDGFSQENEYEKLGKFKILKSKLEISIPKASLNENGVSGLSFYCDDKNLEEHKFVKKIIKNSKKIKRFNAFLDLMPRRIIIDEKYEIIDNRGTMISAHKENINIVNLQVLLKYFSLNYLVSFNILKLKNGYCFYLAYKLAYEIVKWASDCYEKSGKDKFMKFLPSYNVYGKYNWHETYILQRKIFMMTLNKIPKEISKDKPNQAFIETIKDYPIDLIKYEFDPSNSEIYQFDYLERKKKFEPIILYDEKIDNDEKK